MSGLRLTDLPQWPTLWAVLFDGRVLMRHFLMMTTAFAAVAACAPKEDGEVAAAADPGTASVCEAKIVVGDIRTAPGEAAAAIAIKDGRIAEVFTEWNAEKAGDANCNYTLPEGAVAFPGLSDSHAHLLGIGLREMLLNLEGVGSLAALKERVKEAAANTANAELVYGRGWIETGWPEGRMPTATDLDEVVADRPVILTRADGHAVVVNSAALAAAGITDETPDPDGGRIVRDAEGRANGLLIDNASGLAYALLPPLSAERRAAALKLGADVYAAKGWTMVQNMSVDYADDAILRALDADGELPIRVMNYFVPEAMDQVIADGRNCTDDKMVCTMGLKFYVDGALGSRGALLFEPYTDEPETLGLQLMSAEDAEAGFSRARDAGLQVATHAIGDRGNSLVLDWYGDVLGEETNRRWRDEHSQIVRPQDIARFKDEGVIASMQPSHAIGDFHFAPARLGDERLDGAYAWQSMLDAGVVVVGGSDAPVEQGDPRIELHAATRRTDLTGFSGPDWRPEEALSADDALSLFTTNAAYAVFLEDELGKLAPDYRADLTIFSGDPLASDQWDSTHVIGTIVGGTFHLNP